MSPLVIVDASVSRAMPKSTTRGTIGAEQHVGRLEVAVHDPRAVYRGQRGGRPHRQALQLTLTQRAAGHHAFLERWPVDELADDVAQVALGRRFDDAGGDKGLHLVNRVELAAQPFEDRGIDAGPQHLDGHPLFPRARTPAEVDDPLTALAEPAEQLKAAQPQGIARLQRLRRHDFSRIAR